MERASPEIGAVTPHDGAPFGRALSETMSPPVMEARRWIEGRSFPEERPLLNLSQAAPADPPPEALRRRMAEAVLSEPAAHLYGPVLGDPALRREIAAQWSAGYGGAITAADVGVTAGCNQAFCAAVATVAGPGDAVLLPTPWYFNHKMWLDMAGVAVVPSPCGDDGLPDPAAAEAAMAAGAPRIKALTLVSPNNPTGAEAPPALIAALWGVARRHGAALILDETYRDFRAGTGPAHGLFQDAEWREGFLHLYSFSKAYRLTGHRVGAMVAGPTRLAQAEKFLDTTTICAPRLGQIAALEGLRTLGPWLAAERETILARGARLRAEVGTLPAGWRLRSLGAYFAMLEHPFERSSLEVARALVERQSLLCLPGTMFGPSRADGGDGTAERTLRLAFANADEAGVSEALRRLAAFDL